MVYSVEEENGIKRKSIPPPRMVDFVKGSTYEEVIQRGRDLFFTSYTNELSNYCLAGPAGVPFHIEDEEEWSLEEFMKEHGFQPSKTRLYVMILTDHEEV